MVRLTCSSEHEQMQLGHLEPDEDDVWGTHFTLPISLKADVESQTPVFKEITKLDFDTLPGKEKALPFHATDVQCECKPFGRCDERCLNRMLHFECSDGAKGSTGDLAGTGESSGVCSVGGNCGNRALQNREYAKVQAFTEEGRGWGLRVLEPVQSGSLVIEYVGEVINEATMIVSLIILVVFLRLNFIAPSGSCAATNGVPAPAHSQ